MGFYLSRNSIIWQIGISGKVIKISTGITTHHWNAKKQRVEKSEDFAWEKNQILDILESETEQIKVKAKVEGIVPNKEFLEQFVEGLTGKSQKKAIQDRPHFAWQWFEDFRKKMKSIHQPSYLLNFLANEKTLKADFYDFTFDQMSREWMIEMVQYLIDEKELLHNTISRKISELKIVAEYARKLGAEVHPEFNQYSLKMRNYHPFYLDWDTQVKILENVDLPERLDKIRDRFIFRCYTGMRAGELNQLTPAHFFKRNQRTFLKYQDIKGKKPKTIQLSEKAIQIAAKYGMTLPSIHIRYENDAIKEVARKAKLFQPVNKIRHSGNRVITKSLMVCNVISSHTARRTFARRWYEQGGDLLKLSKYLGHSNISITQKYVGVEDDEVGDEMIRIFG